MDRKYKIPFALTILTLALVGCSSNKIKVEDAKPSPLPKLEQSKSLATIFSQSVSSTSEADPLRLQLDIDNGVIFIADPKGEVTAYRGKDKVWSKKVSKQGLSSGVEAKDGMVIVGNHKGQLFALDEATGEQKWTAQLTGTGYGTAMAKATAEWAKGSEGKEGKESKPKAKPKSESKPKSEAKPKPKKEEPKPKPKKK